MRRRRRERGRGGRGEEEERKILKCSSFLMSQIFTFSFLVPAYAISSPALFIHFPTSSLPPPPPTPHKLFDSLVIYC